MRLCFPALLRPVLAVIGCSRQFSVGILRMCLCFPAHFRPVLAVVRGPRQTLRFAAGEFQDVFCASLPFSGLC